MKFVFSDAGRTHALANEGGTKGIMTLCGRFFSWPLNPWEGTPTCLACLKSPRGLAEWRNQYRAEQRRRMAFR